MKYCELKSGQKVYILCAKVDEYGGTEPAIDASTFNWSLVKVLKTVPATHFGDEDVEIEDTVNKWTSTYSRRFILSKEEVKEIKKYIKGIK